MANFFDNFSADEFDAMSDEWQEEEEFWEDEWQAEKEIDSKLAEFGLLDDVEFDDDEDWDENTCPMCGEDIDSDTGYCPVCRELVL